jgi:hypothetical protein
MTTPLPWSPEECRELIGELHTLRAIIVGLAQRHPERLAAADPLHAGSALNLMHYLALRRVDTLTLPMFIFMGYMLAEPVLVPWRQ